MYLCFFEKALTWNLSRKNGIHELSKIRQQKGKNDHEKRKQRENKRISNGGNVFDFGVAVAVFDGTDKRNRQYAMPDASADIPVRIYMQLEMGRDSWSCGTAFEIVNMGNANDGTYRIQHEL